MHFSAILIPMEKIAFCAICIYKQIPNTKEGFTMNSYTLDWAKYVSLARQAAAEGCVLLKNEHQLLPLKKEETISIFGRIQLDYYKSGTGSGGKVNVNYTHGILDGLLDSGHVKINEHLLNIYNEWTAAHPFDFGKGWGQEPWCQNEMPLTDEITANAADVSDTALVILGRTAGEDQDNKAEEGSYYLTETELNMLRTVRRHFLRVAVILNVGNIIDMSWMDDCCPDAVLYAWQGGMEGGMGTADVLTGKCAPSGKLTDTIARKLSDYPSDKNFGNTDQNIYQEDIYVGYRYFETFAPKAVRYPFGFGLSYTEFSVAAAMQESADTLIFTVTVKNTGDFPGKEVVQVYCEAPQGTLGKPSRTLVSFAKTKELRPGEEEYLTLTIPKTELSSFDDSGVTGYAFCRVLETGSYRFFVGTDVRTAAYTGAFTLEHLTVTEQLHEAMAPTVPFTRLRPRKQAEEQFTPVSEEVPLRSHRNTPHAVSEEVLLRNYRSPSNDNCLVCTECADFTDDRNWKLADVVQRRVSLDDFLFQLSDEDLCHMIHGEGMCSPKVTPGTAAAFGGITQRLLDFGIPLGCCTDGPSGIRLDCGANAFSLPNGTMLACTFNTKLVTDLFEMEGLEMRNNRIDTLLGPGINIHRHPLCGRNFEYHSEDPYLTGKMACAQLDGMHRAGVTGTIKHFCANNQEAYRAEVNCIISQRALREIYLRPFEMAVKESNAYSIMTTYGGVNGIWTAGNHDLNTTILREEWGFKGIVMTDWWSRMNDEGNPPSAQNLAAMVRAQNDLYMVTQDASGCKDNLSDALKSGTLTRAELLRCARNICTFLMKSPTMERMRGTEIPVRLLNKPADQDISVDFDMDYIEVSDKTTISLEHADATKGLHPLLAVHLASAGVYRISLSGQIHGSHLAQIGISLKSMGNALALFSVHGSDAESITLSQECNFEGLTHYLSAYYSENGFLLKEITFEKL